MEPGRDDREEPALALAQECRERAGDGDRLELSAEPRGTPDA
jgi:hypothetical protein